MARRYRFKGRFPYASNLSRSAHDAIIRLRRRAPDGIVTPEMIVAEATNPRSPLHVYFEWDNNTAAHQYRLAQARRLCHSIETWEDDTEDQRGVPFRALANVPRDDGSRGYVPMDEALADPGMGDEVMQRFLDELNALRRRFRHARNLRSALLEIGRIAASLR